MAELSQVMKMLGNDLTDQELRDIMKEAGATKSIGYSAFCKLMGGGGTAGGTREVFAAKNSSNHAIPLPAVAGETSWL